MSKLKHILKILLVNFLVKKTFLGHPLYSIDAIFVQVKVSNRPNPVTVEVFFKTSFALLFGDKSFRDLIGQTYLFFFSQ